MQTYTDQNQAIQQAIGLSDKGFSLDTLNGVTVLTDGNSYIVIDPDTDGHDVSANLRGGGHTVVGYAFGGRFDVPRDDNHDTTHGRD